MIFWQKRQDHVEDNDGDERGPPPSPQPRRLAVCTGDGPLEQAHDAEHGGVEADQPDEPSDGVIATGCLEHGEDEILTVGEPEQQQEHHREHC